MRVDPAARRLQQDDGAWRIWLGGSAAILLHGGLLAGLLFTWPPHLAPAPNASAISLLLQPASGPTIVKPKPHAEAAVMPSAPPAKIAIAPVARKTLSSQSALSHVAKPSPAVPALRGAVESKPVTQQIGGGFVAAVPAAGAGNQPPEYPDLARQHGEQGDVLLSIHVQANGEPDSVSVTQSSGYGILDKAAAQAVWKWRFQPSTLAGKPVPSVIPYRIHFNLQDGTAN